MIFQHANLENSLQCIAFMLENDKHPRVKPRGVLKSTIHLMYLPSKVVGFAETYVRPKRHESLRRHDQQNSRQLSSRHIATSVVLRELQQPAAGWQAGQPL